MTKSRLFTTSELLSVALKPRRSNFLSNKIVLSQTMSFSYKPKDTTVQFSHSSTFYSLREQVASKKKRRKREEWSHQKVPFLRLNLNFQSFFSTHKQNQNCWETDSNLTLHSFPVRHHHWVVTKPLITLSHRRRNTHSFCLVLKGWEIIFELTNKQSTKDPAHSLIMP